MSCFSSLLQSFQELQAELGTYLPVSKSLYSDISASWFCYKSKQKKTQTEMGIEHLDESFKVNFSERDFNLKTC